MNMKINNSNKSGQRFRVITFDSDSFGSIIGVPTLMENINSVKTWLQTTFGFANTTEERTNMTKFSMAVPKRSSSSGIANRTGRNKIPKKYTRTRICVESLKQLFMVNKNFYLKQDSSQDFTKKRNLKNMEKLRQRWDKDIKVLYSCETDKLNRRTSQPTSDYSRTDNTVSSRPTPEPSDEVGLLIHESDGTSKGRGFRKLFKPRKICDFRSKYCTNKKPCPCCFETPLVNKICQCSVKSLDGGSSSAAVVCYPSRKDPVPQTDYLNIHANKNACPCCLKILPVRKMCPKALVDRSCSAAVIGCRMDADPQTDDVNIETNKTASPDYVKILQHENKMCQCHDVKAVDRSCSMAVDYRPSRKDADPQTNVNIDTKKNAGPGYLKIFPHENKMTQCHDAKVLVDRRCSTEVVSRPSQNDADPQTDYVIIQANKNPCPHCLKIFPNENKMCQSTDTRALVDRCCSAAVVFRPSRKNADPQTDYVNIQANKNACPRCSKISPQVNKMCQSHNVKEAVDRCCSAANLCRPSSERR